MPSSGPPEEPRLVEKALLKYVPPEREGLAKTFLSGLSLDELFFLIEVLGSSILITSAINVDTWDVVYHQARASRRGHEDGEHKFLLLTEFASRCGFQVKFR